MLVRAVGHDCRSVLCRKTLPRLRLYMLSSAAGDHVTAIRLPTSTMSASISS